MNLLSAMQQKLDARGREVAKAQRTIHKQRQFIGKIQADKTNLKGEVTRLHIKCERYMHTSRTHEDAHTKLKDYVAELERENGSLKLQLKSFTNKG